MDDTEIKVAKENEQSASSADNVESAENEFEFVTETIKKKPINKKKAVIRILVNILMGVLLGVVACLVFVLLEPRLYAKFYPEKPNLISIPKDENEEIPEEEIEEIVIDEVAETPAPEDQEPSDSIEENTEEEKTEESVPATIINQIVEKKEVTLDDYKLLYRQMGEVANNAKKAMVTVTGVTEGTDWFMNSYETGNQTTGLILADNGKELLIIANMISLLDAREIEVTFSNDMTYAGSVKKSDKETGLVVVAVNLDDLTEGTKSSIEMASLGNSSISTLPGTPVMAVGAPLGVFDSMATGIITSNNHVMDVSDSSLKYLTTDIYGSVNANGVIVDLEGKVLGIIFPGGTNSDTKNLIHAYAISDIKTKIEKLSNGQELAYLGIKGTDVTKEANEELGVPLGAYITQVMVDSPAMKEGLQNGDVIVKIGTTDITSFADYKDAMLKCQPGDFMMFTVERLSKDGYVELSFEITLETLK